MKTIPTPTLTLTNYFSILICIIFFSYTPVLLAQSNYTIDTLPIKFKSISGIVSDTANKQVWIATNKGLYNTKTKKYVFKHYARFIILDKNAYIWAITEGDTIRLVSKEGDLKAKFYFAQGQSGLENASITSISTYNDFIYIGTNSNKIIYFRCSIASKSEVIEKGEIKSTNVYHALSIYAEQPQNNEAYSTIICGSDGVYLGEVKDSKAIEWNLKKASEDIKIPDSPIKILPSKKNANSSKIYFWLIGWNGYSSVAGKLVVDKTNGYKANFVQSDCLEKTAYQPYDFALTQNEDLWMATANGLVYYTLHAKCDSVINKQDTCVVQGIRQINQSNDPEFPLQTIHHIALENDSTIWFAANKGYVYKLTLKPDTLGQKTKISPKDARYKLFNFKAYTESEKKQHTEFPDDQASGNTTGKKRAEEYKKEIKKALSENPALEVHLIAFAKEQPAESSKKAIDIAQDRMDKMVKFLNIPDSKTRVKKHIIGYLPTDKGGPENPETVKAIISCSCQEFEEKADVD